MSLAEIAEIAENNEHEPSVWRRQSLEPLARRSQSNESNNIRVISAISVQKISAISVLSARDKNMLSARNINLFL